jgi:hypothetical protein
LRWPRNPKNLAKLRKLMRKRTGLYVLANGSMPLYIGKGIVARRVRAHAREGGSKSKYWNYFSWFEIPQPRDGELECLLLQVLPFYVRSLNRKTGSLGKKNRQYFDDENPKTVDFPKLLPKKKKKPR